MRGRLTAGPLVLSIIMMAGCADTSALLMSGADVDQAVKLKEANDLKHCGHVDGSGSFWSVNGKVETYTALGKNVTLDECFKFFNPTMGIGFGRAAP